MLRILLLGLLLILIARAFWRVVDGIIAGASGQAPGGRGQARPVKLIRDPVCGTFVAPATARSLTAGGQTHYFCSEECRAKFHS